MNPSNETASNLGQLLRQKLTQKDAEQQVDEDSIVSKTVHNTESIKELILSTQDNLNRNLQPTGITCDLVSGEMTLKFMNLYTEDPECNSRIIIQAAFDLKKSDGCYLSLALDVTAAGVTAKFDTYHANAQDAGVQEILAALMNTLIQDCIPE